MYPTQFSFRISCHLEHSGWGPRCRLSGATAVLSAGQGPQGPYTIPEHSGGVGPCPGLRVLPAYSSLSLLGSQLFPQ